MRAFYWTIRGRSGRGPWWAVSWTHAAAEAAVAAALLLLGLGISRAAGAPLPVFGAVHHKAQAVAATGPSASPPPEVRAELIPGGTGRAVLILSGDQALLVDGGPPAVGEAVVGRLRAMGIERVAAAVMTSARAGAALGLMPVLDALPVGRILDLVPGSTCPAHQAVLKDARAHGTPVQVAERGAAVSVGAARLEVLWPAADLAQPGAAPGDPGLVRLVDGSVRLLLAGGIAAQDLQALQRLGPLLGAQVLEVPDHAAADGLAPAFLRAVAPRVAVIEPASATPPDPAVLARLADARVVMVETSRADDLRLQTDGHGLILAFDPGLPGQMPPDPVAEAGSAAPAQPAGPCD